MVISNINNITVESLQSGHTIKRTHSQDGHYDEERLLCFVNLYKAYTFFCTNGVRFIEIPLY